MATRPLVSTIGLKEFRRDLRGLDKTFSRTLNKSLREAMGPITSDAIAAAPLGKSGKLRGSIRPFASGSSIGVRSRLPYANAIHWGGTVGRGHDRGAWQGASVLVRRPVRLADGMVINAYKPFVWEAVARHKDGLEDRIADAVFDAAVKHGWH